MTRKKLLAGGLLLVLVVAISRLRGRGRKRTLEGGALEIYDRSRFLTVTGHRLKSAPASIMQRQRVLDAVMREFFADATVVAAPAKGHALRIADKVVIEIACAARNASEFWALYHDGDLSRFDGDASRADYALAKTLCFYTGGDAAQVERLFSASALGQRAKWSQRADYRAQTIARARAQTTHFYDPHHVFNSLMEAR
jgi:putative DNA primase/helicase